MSTHISGKRVAAGITTVAAIGSLAVAGFGAVSLESATASTAVSNQNSGSSTGSVPPQVHTAPKTDVVIKAPTATKHRPARTRTRNANPVKQGNGAATHAKSSGS
ncbi:MAG: hypothetical protein Q4P23_16140 [Micrococcaceae bacterium]|nr:hypothetical protein [Micrococcaceae bacterium]